MRTSLALLGAGMVAALAFTAERDAHACGGCFQPPPPPGENETVITDHRMVLSVSPQQTTLYDEIRYQGSPAEFAWVLPIAGTATVGLSSDTLFQALDQLTGTIVQAPPTNCPAPPKSCLGKSFGASGGGDNATPTAGGAEDAGVTVTKQETVGPYETVQLHSTDPNALNAWLSSHGYVIPADVQPVVAAYVNEHFDFLAMKLVPGTGVSAMRPVRVTTAGASPVLPLRMVAAGTGAIVGITLWIMADGRYEPQNFPFFHIADSELVWDWSTSASNYSTLRATKETASGNQAWEIESSTTQQQQTVRSYVTSIGRGFGFSPDGGQDYLPIPAPDGGGVQETADQVRQDDLNALFAGIGTTDGQVRVTRVRTDLAHAALANDLTLTASQDQSVLSNLRQVTQEQGEPQCPVYNAQCQQIGTKPRSQAIADANAVGNSFGCATASQPLDVETMGAAVGLFGVAFIGMRRRRRS